MSTPQVAVSGAGIGGLSLALSLAQSGVQSVLFERQPDWSEVGAGVQLGPNATRRLQTWGLGKALEGCASWPDRVEVFDGVHGKLLATLPLGEQCRHRYGAPYATLMRADLQTLLQERVAQLGLTDIHLGEKVLHASVTSRIGALAGDPSVTPSLGDISFDVQSSSIGVDLESEGAHELSGSDPSLTRHNAQVLVGADGVFSRLRETHFKKLSLKYTGHLAYRAMIRWSDLPPAMRSSSVQLFLAPRLHWVQYPVKAGEWLNVVVLLEVSPREREHVGESEGEGEGHKKRFLNNPWGQQASQVSQASASGDQNSNVNSNSSQDLQALMQAVELAHGQLKDLASLVQTWTLWPLFACTPMSSSEDMARGRLALLGDAAHPMLPYLAQGAGMSIEDAQVFSLCWAQSNTSVSERLKLYAEMRWQRCAQVQNRALRNARVFHYGQPLGLMRDLAIRALGARLLDMPWLYSY